MATQITTISATPVAPTTGADVNKGGALTPAELDQNFVNLRESVDSAPSYSTGTWTPTYTTALAVTGAIAIVGYYTRIGNRVFCSIVVGVNGGTTAAAAGCYFSLPPDFPAQVSSVCDVLCQDLNTNIGSGVVAVANCYVPTWSATGYNMVISFNYQIAT